MADAEEADCEPLAWGRGPHLFDVFLEPTCPHSGRAFGKLPALLERVGQDRVTIRITIQSQPWHMFSGVVSRAVLAAAATQGGKEAARQVMEQVYANREDFEFTDHSSGPNMDATPNEILRRIEGLTGLALAEAFRLDGVTAELTRQTRFARQNGIHVSPTFMIDGLVNEALGSRDEVGVWAEAVSASRVAR